MYRNIDYRMYKRPDSKVWQSLITLFTWDENGNPITEEYEYQPYIYMEHPDGDEVAYDGKKIKKMIFENIWEMKKWKETHPTLKLYDSISPERQFLIDYYGGKQESNDFTKFPLRFHVLDIEVATEDESVDELLKMVNRPLNVVTIYDSKYSKYFVWVLLDKRWLSDGSNFKNTKDREYFVFSKEDQFLVSIIMWFKKNYPDILTGWNVDFDIRYMLSRINKVLGEEYLNMLSPVNVVREVSKKKRLGGITEEYTSFNIKGVSIIDYLFLYRDKFLQKEYSYKLGHVGQEQLGLNKIEYSCSFKEFYRKNFFLFVEYNIRDVEIVVELNKKFKFIELSRKICNFGLCEYEAITRSSPYILGALILQSRELNKHMYTGMASYYERDNEEDEEYEGAFVFDVQPCIKDKGITSFDLNSLYPNIMININISPETKIGKVLERREDEIFFKIGDKRYNTSLTKFEEIAKDRFTVSSYDIIYQSPIKKKGIIPIFLERLYNSRKAAKKKMQILQKQLLTMEKTHVDYSKMDDEAVQLSGIEQAYKIFLNSIYGQLGSKYFPLYDIENAASVTLSGQTVIKESMKFINEFLSNNYNNGHKRDFVSYGDTDSCYVDCEAIIQKTLVMQKIDKNTWTDDNIDKITKHIDENITKVVNDNCKKISREHFYSPLTNIEFKRETFCSTGVFFTKKKYILNVRDDEGKKKNKWKYVGVDIKRNELPIMVKDCLEHVIQRTLLDDWTFVEYEKYIKELWQKYQTVKPNDIAYMKGYKSFKESAGFLMMEKGTTVMAKSSAFYNDIIKHQGLSSKYDKIQVGDRIRYVYLKPNNIYGIEVIAWKEEGEYPEEFDKIFEIDYACMFQKTDYFLKLLIPMSKSLGFWLVYEIDDVIGKEDIPRYNPAWATFQNDRLMNNVKTILQHIDFLTVTTEELGKYYVEKFNVSKEKILVIPNYLPMWWIGENYNVNKSIQLYRNNIQKPRVGFISSASHVDIKMQNNGIDDFTHILPYIEENINRFQFVCVGTYPRQLKKYIDDKMIEYYPGFDILNYPRLVNNLNLQLIIAPLINNLFNTKKSEIKYIESGALGVPCVLQDISTYKNCPCPKFTDVNSLSNQVDKILGSEEIYVDEIKKNRDFVDNDKANGNNGWWLEKNINKWFDLFTLNQKTIEINLENIKLTNKVFEVDTIPKEEIKKSYAEVTLEV